MAIFFTTPVRIRYKIYEAITLKISIFLKHMPARTRILPAMTNTAAHKSVPGPPSQPAATLSRTQGLKDTHQDAHNFFCLAPILNHRKIIKKYMLVKGIYVLLV